MDRFSSFIQNRKAFLIGGGIVGLLGIGAIILFQSSSPSPTPSTSSTSKNALPTRTVAPSTGAVNKPTIVTNPKSGQQPTNQPSFAQPVVVPGWSSAQEGGLILQLPPDWKQESTPIDEGETLVLKPVDSSPDATTPLFMVTTVKGQSLGQIEQKENMFILMGFTKTTATLGGIPVTQVRGTFPPENAQGIPEDKFLQETHISFVKNNVGYQIKYTYPGKIYNDFYERLYSIMISTIIFR